MQDASILALAGIRRRWLPGSALALALLSGCASAPPAPTAATAPKAGTAEPPSACAAFEASRKTTRYTTVYRLAASDSDSAARNFKPLPAGENARARHYTLRFDRDEVSPCNHLLMRKELYLQRIPKTALGFQETREFFAGDGTLIAVKNETLDNQLPATGYYVATVPLPIPANAPAGNYRVVTKLVMQNTNGKAQLLATTSANFVVTARR